jgi:hypothetical protein
MVHKSQESLARDVLSVYPWFAGKNQEIKAVREGELEYDPTADGGKSELNWDSRSIASTDMLGGYGKGSELGTPYGVTPAEEYGEYPLPTRGGEYGHYPLPNNDSSVFNLPLDNPSTDHLISQSGRSDAYGPRRQASRPYPHPNQHGDSISSAPLLDNIQPTPLSPQHSVPYPPSAFTSPPAGYTPPAMRRMDTSASGRSDGSYDMGTAAPSYYSQSQSGYTQPGQGYQVQNQDQGRGRQGSLTGSSRGPSPPRGYADPYDVYNRR